MPAQAAATEPSPHGRSPAAAIVRISDAQQRRLAMRPIPPREISGKSPRDCGLIQLNPSSPARAGRVQPVRPTVARRRAAPAPSGPGLNVRRPPGPALSDQSPPGPGSIAPSLIDPDRPVVMNAIPAAQVALARGLTGQHGLLAVRRVWAGLLPPARANPAQAAHGPAANLASPQDARMGPERPRAQAIARQARQAGSQNPISKASRGERSVPVHGQAGSGRAARSAANGRVKRGGVKFVTQSRFRVS
jgi:hypothetical protein